MELFILHLSEKEIKKEKSDGKPDGKEIGKKENKADRHKSRARNSISHRANRSVSWSTFLPLKCLKTQKKQSVIDNQSVTD